MAETEVAGRPPLPRHKGLPAGKKGDQEMEGRRARTASREEDGGDAKEREA